MTTQPIPQSLAQEFENAMLRLYRRWRDEVGYRAERFRQMIVLTGNRRSYVGALAAARKLIHGGVSPGFLALMAKGRLDLTVEALALSPRFRPLFAESDLLQAARKLAAAKRLASTGSP